jgi:hypothetical protein
MTQGFQVTTSTRFGNITTGTGGSGFQFPSGTSDRSTGTGRTGGSGASSIIDAIGNALSAVGGAVGNIITSVGTSRALQNGTYYSPYNQGQYNSNYVGIALIAVAAVSILVIAKK